MFPSLYNCVDLGLACRVREKRLCIIDYALGNFNAFYCTLNGNCKISKLNVMLHGRAYQPGLFVERLTMLSSQNPNCAVAK